MWHLDMCMLRLLPVAPLPYAPAARSSRPTDTDLNTKPQQTPSQARVSRARSPCTAVPHHFCAWLELVEITNTGVEGGSGTASRLAMASSAASERGPCQRTCSCAAMPSMWPEGGPRRRRCCHCHRIEASGAPARAQLRCAGRVSAGSTRHGRAAAAQPPNLRTCPTRRETSTGHPAPADALPVWQACCTARIVG